MNYPPNVTTWKRGDIVIHDADAKNASMLMVVVGYSRDGFVKTRYVDGKAATPRGSTKIVYKNELRFLLDPKAFGIAIPAATEQAVTQ